MYTRQTMWVKMNARLEKMACLLQLHRRDLDSGACNYSVRLIPINRNLYCSSANTADQGGESNFSALSHASRASTPVAEFPTMKSHSTIHTTEDVQLAELGWIEQLL